MIHLGLADDKTQDFRASQVAALARYLNIPLKRMVDLGFPKPYVSPAGMTLWSAGEVLKWTEAFLEERQQAYKNMLLIPTNAMKFLDTVYLGPDATADDVGQAALLALRCARH
jgi:hypothetical protein